MFRFLIPFLLSILCSAHAETNFVVGRDNSSGSYLPLLVQTSDKGQSWIAGPLNNSNVNPAGLTTLSCTDSICVAAGYNNDENSSLLAQSYDNGQHWEEVNLSGTTTHFKFDNSSCFGDTCIIIGRVKNPQNSFNEGSPAIIRTNDAGKSWNAVSSEFLSKLITLKDVKCLDNFCLVVGRQCFDEYCATTKSILLESRDNGLTWAKNRTANLPGSLSAVDCNEQRCVIAGFLHKDQTMFPVLYEINLNNSAFKVIQIDALSKREGRFSSVSCNDDTCVAVGIGGDMLIADSTRALAWKYQTIKNTEKAFLTEVDCSDQECIAAGIQDVSGDASANQGMVISNRTGAWQSVALPVEARSIANLWIAHCDNSLCYVGGAQSNEEPLLMQSIEGGKWQTIHPDGMSELSKLLASGKTE